VSRPLGVHQVLSVHAVQQVLIQINDHLVHLEIAPTAIVKVVGVEVATVEPAIVPAMIVVVHTAVIALTGQSAQNVCGLIFPMTSPAMS
jgi:hypothetical protein